MRKAASSSVTRRGLSARHLRPDEVQGKTVFDVFPRAIALRMDEQDRRIIASGEGIDDHESLPIFLDENGNPLHRWSSTTKVPMRDGDGSIIGIVGISRDITSRRRLEHERAMEHMVARVLSESRSIEETMPRLIRTVGEAMDCAYGAHWRWDSASGSMRRAAWWCEFEPAIRRCRRDLVAGDRHSAQRRPRSARRGSTSARRG